MADWEANIPTRRSQFHRLLEISDLLPPLSTATLSPQDLQDARIELRTMSLVPGENEPKPAQYYIPIPVDELTKGLRCQVESDEEDIQPWPPYDREWNTRCYMAIKYADKILDYADNVDCPPWSQAEKQWSYHG